MHTPLVMTVIGKDRPGLVESVAKTIADQGGNWLESRMCRLGGMFAGILRADIDAHRQAALVSALKNLSGEGVVVDVHADQAVGVEDRRRLIQLEIVGQDRPGIVRHITGVIAGQGVNVEELQTECGSAPMSGETLFKATAKLALPQTCDLAKLRAELEKIATDLMVDASLEELRDTP